MRADYTLNELTKPPPRKLHAFNPSKLTVRHRRSLSEPKPKPTVLPKTTNGEQGKSFLSSATKLTSQTLKTLICWAVIDSGCSWHCHPHAEDLINTRPCGDTMTGIDGKPQAVKCIGDLPALARDRVVLRVHRRGLVGVFVVPRAICVSGNHTTRAHFAARSATHPRPQAGRGPGERPASSRIAGAGAVWGPRLASHLI